MIIDGKGISKEIMLELSKEVQSLKSKGITPGLAVILVGDNPASRTYVNNKKKACNEIGIHSEEYYLPKDSSQDEILTLINSLNSQENIHGILTQLPLPNHINEYTISQAILPEKDVDCFNEINIGKLYLGKAKLFPCTPMGIIELLKHNNIKIEGKNCTIIGRSNIVGKPLSLMLLNENATVTICHSKTPNIKKYCKNADILISAVGKIGLITADMVTPGTVVIDVGMNRQINGKLCGDVDFEQIKDIASFITPVPGGVGPMTIAMLMKNTLEAAKKSIKN